MIGQVLIISTGNVTTFSGPSQWRSSFRHTFISDMVCPYGAWKMYDKSPM